MDCSRGDRRLVASSDRFAPHFHLPLQHASNRVLAAMRRPYTIDYYASLVDDIRARIPDASIGSDIIVGFPGETDEDFEQLAAYLERSPLTHLHVFPYSDRPGTAASAMAGKVARRRRPRARRAAIRDIGRAADRAVPRLAGRHDASRADARGRLAGRDGNYLKVRIPPGRARNEWVRRQASTSHDRRRAAARLISSWPSTIS